MHPEPLAGSLGGIDRCETCGVLVWDVAAHRRWANGVAGPVVNTREAAARSAKAARIAGQMAAQGIGAEMAAELGSRTPRHAPAWSARCAAR